MRISILQTTFSLLFIALLFSCNKNESNGVASEQEAYESQAPNGKKWQSIKDALEYEIEITKDPKLGYVPTDRLAVASKVAQERQLKMANQRSKGLTNTLDEAEWESRGPDNVGGRTRAIHIDLNDPERKKVWVGGVSGGLWVTEDITQNDPQWRLVNDYWQTLAIGGIAQDPTNPDILYVGTGEGYTNDVRGNGAYRSFDGGETWEHVPTTIGKTAYRAIQEVVIDTKGDIYLATATDGLHKSTNGGTSFFKVLANGISGGTGNFINDVYLHEDGTIFASSQTSIHRSPSGNAGTWANIGRGMPGFSSSLQRVEFTVCPSNKDIIYVIGNAGGGMASDFYSTINGGNAWSSQATPAGSNQAWYDLEIAVDPFDCSFVFFGEVPLRSTSTGGIGWANVGGLHVDHHAHVFDTENQGVVYFGNDGGIWRSGNRGFSIQDKNQGYITTQFYGCALHPDIGSNYMLGGTQDNNSLQMNSPGKGPATNVNGGDGVFCFIDQNEPNIQIVSSQFGNYNATFSGFQGGPSSFASVSGNFINKSDYDDDANLLYGQTSQGDFFRWSPQNSLLEFIDISNANAGNANAFLADPNVDNKLWIGSGSNIFTIENAHEGDVVLSQTVDLIPGGGSINCIYIDKTNPNDVLVAKSNYGVQSVFLSTDGGDTYQSIEGDLPDMPVRWAMFDPFDHTKVLIATDMGVWSTEKVDGNNTEWLPPNMENGSPLVRVDMFQIRESDNVVLAATYGRGLYTSEIFSRAQARFNSPEIVYAGIPFTADGSPSIKAEKFEWSFGDGETAEGETVEYTYTNPGVYNIILVIDEGVSFEKQIAVLPSLNLPYDESIASYDGNFENNLSHFAAFSNSGSKFSKGNSSVTGKNGTSSGQNAWVLGISEDEYQENTVAYLYTPAYDFSELTLYNLKFMSRYLIHNRFDGFRIQYTTSVGGEWRQLGDHTDENWYNYNNQNLDNGAFPSGTQYFTGTQAGFKEFGLDLSFFGGEEFVAFRVEFRSEDTGFGIGLVIDDFAIEKFDGELVTNIVSQNAQYSNESEVTIQWTTEPEFQAKFFEVERSYDGINYEVIETIPATGKTSQIPQTYSRVFLDIRPTIFYRIHSVNENTNFDYFLEFRSPIMVVKRNPDETLAVFNLFPNPFTDQISITFNNIVQEEVIARLFDTSGRLVFENVASPGDVFLQLNELDVAAGIYLLNIQIGNGEGKTFKLYGGHQ